MYIGCSENLSLEMNRGGREDSKHVFFSKFGGGLKLRHGGATTGHRAGKLKLAGEETGRRRCNLLQERGRRSITFVSFRKLNIYFFHLTLQPMDLAPYPLQ
jgi:hypothetical protein